MRSALPEEIVTRSEGEDVKDTVFTVPLLRDCIINMVHDMEKDIGLPLKRVWTRCPRRPMEMV